MEEDADRKKRIRDGAIKDRVRYGVEEEKRGTRRGVWGHLGSAKDHPPQVGDRSRSAQSEGI